MEFHFPCGSAGKESTCNAGDLGLTPGLGRYTGEGKGYPLQYSGLETSMDYIVHGVAKSWTWLSDFHFSFLTRDQTQNSLHWEHKVLATGPPGKSLILLIDYVLAYYLSSVEGNI